MCADSIPADVEAIFAAAVEKDSPAEQASYLVKACGSDSELRARVEALLNAHKAASGRYFDAPLYATTASAADLPLTEGPGTVIGRYKLLELIGEGGFGAVYMAEQEEPVRRRVALKIIKLGMDTKQVTGRFEAERQALAMMDHPNIAKVLDGGSTQSGRPYFVMDLVRGLPITEYCDKQQLSTHQRLQLFVNVCHAVQHAHQKGIIHRDIKPTNVLVTRNGDRGVPKVIDFGVAKATNQRLTERTIFTQFNQMIGTPLYMSPEQAEMSELDVDTRSDVYSLGVVLYELLTGSTPFEKEEINAASFDEIRRIIREEEPLKPSYRISTLAAEALSTITSRRSCEPHQLNHIIRGELDWIVLMALEKDRARRYESASAFAADVERYLDDEPVAACPPSVSYRLQKFARRNKVAMTTAGIVVLTLLLGIAGTSWQAWRAITERDEKQAALIEKNEALAAAEANLQLTMRAVDEVYLQSLGEERLLRLQSDVGMFPMDAMEMEAHRPVESRLELSQQDRELIQRGLVFYEQIARQNPSSQVARFESARALSRVALLQTSLGEIDQAQKAYTDAIWRLEKLTEQDPRRTDYFLELGRAYYQQGQLSRWWPQASNTFDAAVKATSRSIELDPQSIEAYRLRGKANIAKNEYDLAVADFERVVELDPNDATFQDDLGRLLYHMGEADRALPYAKRAVELDPQNNRHYGYRHHLADIYRWGKKDATAAAAVWEEALPFITDPRQECDIRSKISDALEDHQRTIELVNRWIELGEKSHEVYLRRATAFGKLGDIEPAIADLKTAAKLAVTDWDWICIAVEYRRLQQFELELAAYDEAIQLNPNNCDLYGGRAYALSRLDRLQEALKDCNKALELLPRDSRVASSEYRMRAHVLYWLGDFNEAMEDFKKALELDPSRTDWVNTIAWVLVTCRPENRNPEEALEWVQKAIKRDPERANFWNVLGVVYYRLGEYEQALMAHEKSIALGDEGSFNYFFIAMAHWQLDAQEVAREFYDKAIKWMNQEAPNDRELIRFRAEAEQLMGITDERTEEKNPTATTQ